MEYEVDVIEHVSRTAYVEAPTAAEARRLATDPSQWLDATDPESTSRITVKAVRRVEE